MSKPRDVVVVRVSEKGDREDEHFHSPEVQIEAARRWASDRGEWLAASPIPEIDVSGKLPLSQRPGLLAAIEMIEAGQADQLVVAYSDRLVRIVRSRPPAAPFTTPLTFPTRGPGRARSPAPATVENDDHAGDGRKPDRGPLTAGSRSLPGSAGGDRCVEQVCGSLPAERLARSLVDLDSDPRMVLDGVHGQVGAVREVVAQQPVHVLVASPLPRRMRLAEEHAGSCRGADLPVQGKLFALIPRQRPPQAPR